MILGLKDSASFADEQRVIRKSEHQCCGQNTGDLLKERVFLRQTGPLGRKMILRKVHQ
jgi:hypothetical protein